MKALLVEDQRLFRDLLTLACERRAIAVQTAETVAQARVALRQGEFDFALIDLRLPDGDGFDLAPELQAGKPRLRAIAMSATCDEYTVHRLRQSPFFAFVDKTSQSVEELHTVIDAVMRNDQYFSPTVEALFREVQSDKNSFIRILTSREITILSRVGAGKLDEEIGKELGLSAETIRWHRKKLMQKLSLHNLSGLVLYAMRKGFCRLR